MITKVKKYMEQFQMLRQGDYVVVGVSGGADSMCLLSVMLELKEEYDLTLFVVHVNHNIRGLEADNDERFVVQFCDNSGISVHVVNKKVKEIAKENGWSEEEAGRNIRYAAFFEECEQKQCHKIAIAHNKNDNAETVLFNLLRGSGIHGMAGIMPRREQIIRPLLNISRNEIEEYLNNRQIPYRIDATNLEEDYSRNKIRLSMIPYAEREINAKAVQHIVSMAEQMTEVADFIDKVTFTAYNEMVKKTKIGFELIIEEFQKLDIAIQKSLIRKIIFLWMKQLKDIQEGHIMDVIALLNKQVGKYIYLPYGIIVKRAYESIVFLKEEAKQGGIDEFLQKDGESQGVNVTLPCYVQVPARYNLRNYGYLVWFELVEYKNSMIIPKNWYTKWFDYDKIKTAVVLRTRRTGDYLQISKQGGKKTLKAIFIDNKIPSESRDEIPLLCDGDHVLWILGNRTSEGYHIDESTKTVLVVQIEKCEQI